MMVFNIYTENVHFIFKSVVKLMRGLLTSMMQQVLIFMIIVIFLGLHYLVLSVRVVWIIYWALKYALFEKKKN